MAYFYLAAAACLVGVFLHAPLATDAQPMPWHRCNATSGNYTANSTYHANIQYLATSLPAYASSSPSLFASGSSGAPPDAIYALALCRGDTTNASSCATCVAAAIQAAQKHCALVKTVAIYDDPCIVRFSNLVFPVSPPYNKGMFVAWDDNNVSAAAAATFAATVARLANATAEHAAADSVRRFATGEEESLAVAGEVYPKIYSLAQCTPDMSADACRSCLEDILVRMVPTYLAGRKGGRVLGVRCNFRFETYPFFFGQPLLQLPGSPASSSAPVNGERSKHKRSTVIGILVPAIALSSIVAWFCSWRWRRRLAARTLELIPTESSTDYMQSIGSLLLDLSTLRVATDDFSEHKRLGEGGFGVVYKGDLPKGQEIAVKRLAKTSKQGIEELKTELLLVAKLNHNNLVKLIGVCLEENEKILVYEYMPNRSLDNILFDAQKIKELNWGQRFKIINGIARGLQYLHEDSQLKIVHRDLKASNVLLDSAYNPKISDFGLAKIFERDQSKVITHRIAGTYGYMSPEYAMRGQYSIKSDVFSFGVLVLEIITGRRNFGSYGLPFGFRRLVLAQIRYKPPCPWPATTSPPQPPASRCCCSTYAPLTDAQTMLVPSCNSTNGNYTANSTYHANIQYLATSLPSYASSSPSLFASGSTGTVPDAIFALALRRGDTNSSSCATCVAAAIQSAQELCPLVKTVIVYDDTCILRFSNEAFPISPTSNSQGMVVALNAHSVSAAVAPAFEAAVVRLINTTADYAATDSVRRFGTGEEAFDETTSYPKFYSLAQGYPLEGLESTSGRENYWEVGNLIGRLGGRVLGVRCNFRFEVNPFFSGRSLLQLPVPSPSPAPPVIETRERSKNKRSAVLAISMPTIALVLATIAAWFCSTSWRRRRLARKTLRPNEVQCFGSLVLDLQTLRTATDNFSEHKRLGEGGFGVVYKGDLPEGQEIAVKRLAQTSRQGIEELKTKLLLVAKLNHNNLVRLIGVCLEENEKILAYEYMPNRSLDTILFDAERIKELDWGQRFKIINGIARGLQYLHEDSQLKIVHRDLKASNVLLDSAYNPKISDFGLAKIFERDQSQVITHRIAGTYGYMSPEYAMRGQYSIKSDVYSFGVLVSEIITGRRNFGSYGSDHVVDLIYVTWEHWTSDKAIELIDPSLGNRYPVDKVLKCIHIGLLCVQPKPADRPLMSAINAMLSSTGTIRLPSLSRPSFWFQEIGATASSGANSEQNPHNSRKMSQNEAPITELEPR
uniref:Cysteine-rich receptor-like protein kinase 10 n=1 Tax=Oryza meridionalis TaxID=40149 RepID=A0A0E0ECN8_9ORYZ